MNQNKKKIEELTPAQIAKFPEYVAKYVGLGLSTLQLNPFLKEELTNIIGRVYKAGGLEAPKQVLFYDSPKAVLEAACCMKYGVSSDKITQQMLNDEHANFIYGSQDASWLSFYAFFQNETEITGIEPLNPLMSLLGKCSFILPYDSVCFVSQNLSQVSMANGRLHNTTGPAWSYADGFCGYSLQGIAVPKFVIDCINGANHYEDVLKIRNVEQRLVAIRHIGIQHFMREFKGREIDQFGVVQADGRPEYVLHEVTIAGEKEKLLEMKNPSEDKRHYEFVPPTVKSAQEAYVTRFGHLKGKYKAPSFKA